MPEFNSVKVWFQRGTLNFARLEVQRFGSSKVLLTTAGDGLTETSGFQALLLFFVRVQLRSLGRTSWHGNTVVLSEEHAPSVARLLGARFKGTVEAWARTSCGNLNFLRQTQRGKRVCLNRDALPPENVQVVYQGSTPGKDDNGASLELGDLKLVEGKLAGRPTDEPDQPPPDSDPISDRPEVLPQPGLDTPELLAVLHWLSTARPGERAQINQFLRSPQAGQPGDPERLAVLLELQKVPAFMASELGRYLNACLSAPGGATVEELRRQMGRVTLASGRRQHWVNEYSTRVLKRLVEVCPGSLDGKQAKRAGEVGQSFSTTPLLRDWPLAIANEPRWNRIESPFPGLPDLPLTESWVHLRLRRLRSRRLGLHSRGRDRWANDGLVAETVPLYLDEEHEDRRAGEPLLDVLNRTRALTVIVGQPGAGKTTLLKWLARFLVLEAGSHFSIPIFIGLRDFAFHLDRDPSLDLFDYFLHQRGVRDPVQLSCWFELRQRLLDDERPVADRSVFLWLLDGWDEVPLPLRPAVLERLEAIAHEPGFITSRHAASPLALPVEDFFEVGVLPRVGQRHLVEQWLHAMGRDVATSEVQSRIDRSPAYRRLARNPMLLTLLCGLLSEPGTSSKRKNWRGREMIYRETVRRIMAHHTARHPEAPFDEGGLALVEKLAADCLLRDSPRYLFTESEVQAVVQNADFFRSVLEPSRLICCPTMESRTYQFIHATFHEFFCASWLVSRTGRVDEALARRLLMDRGLAEVARFVAAPDRRSTAKAPLWAEVRRHLERLDEYGVILARICGLLAEAGARDGGSELVGRDLRGELWQLILRHREANPLLLTDALLDLDSRAFINLAREQLAARVDERPIEVLPFLRFLPDEVTAAIFADDGTSTVPANQGDQLVETMDQARARGDFAAFRAAYEAMLSVEDELQVHHDVLPWLAEFGEVAVEYLLEILTTHPDREVKEIAAQTLAEAECPAAARGLIFLLASRASDDPVLGVTLSAVRGERLTAVEVDLVINLLGSARDPEVRRSAAAVLGASRVSPVARRLVAASKDERDAGVRGAIFDALREQADASILSELWGLIRPELDRGVRAVLRAEPALKAVVWTAGRDASRPRHASILVEVTNYSLKWLRGRHSELARVAAQLAPLLGEELMPVLLETVMEHRHSPEVRIECCQALEQVGTPDIVPELLKVLLRPDEEADDHPYSLHTTIARAVANLAPAALAGVPGNAAEAARSSLAFEHQVLFMPVVPGPRKSAQTKRS